jgi:fused signal recognition particle receptor
LSQVKQFHEAVGVSGICLTKLDGTAKGGIAFAIVQKTGIPIRFIGLGEDIDDLKPFDAKEFVEALFC